LLLFWFNEDAALTFFDLAEAIPTLIALVEPGLQLALGDHGFQSGFGPAGLSVLGGVSIVDFHVEFNPVADFKFRSCSRVRGFRDGSGLKTIAAARFKARRFGVGVHCGDWVELDLPEGTGLLENS